MANFDKIYALIKNPQVEAQTDVLKALLDTHELLPQEYFSLFLMCIAEGKINTFATLMQHPKSKKLITQNGNDLYKIALEFFKNQNNNNLNAQTIITVLKNNVTVSENYSAEFQIIFCTMKDKIEKRQGKNTLEFYRDLNAVDFLNIHKIYKQFYKDCEKFAPQLANKTLVNALYFDFIIALWETKIEAIDLIYEKGEAVPLIDNMALWTQKRQEITDKLRLKLDDIFEPILKDTQKEKIFLYSKHGKDVVLTLRQVEGIAHPSFGFLGDLLDIKEFLFSQVFNVDNDRFSVDIVMNNIFWSALSAQYVLNSDGRNIEVYLPLGEIRLNNIFWNQELYTLMNEKNKGRNIGEIVYYQLNKNSQSLLRKEIIKEEEIKKSVEALSNDMDKAKQNQWNSQSDLSQDQIEKQIKLFEDELNQVQANIKSITENPLNWEITKFEDLNFQDTHLKIIDLFKFTDKFKALSQSPDRRPDVMKVVEKTDAMQRRESLKENDSPFVQKKKI